MNGTQCYANPEHGCGVGVWREWVPAQHDMGIVKNEARPKVLGRRLKMNEFLLRSSKRVVH